jgi:S phase cyclin A-associated protein in the endoplasmic reticulum
MKQREENIENLLKEEGAECRNIVSWRVPNDEPASSISAKGQNTSTRSGRPAAMSPTKSVASSSSARKQSASGSTVAFSKEKSIAHLSERLWSLLFRNVNQAVDELYHLCEAESSTHHCSEAATMLHSCGRDFTKLIERLKEQSLFEESPTKSGVAWEVRKTTSGTAAPTVTEAALLQSAMEQLRLPQNSKWTRPPTLVPDAQTASPVRLRQQQQQQQQQRGRATAQRGRDKSSKDGRGGNNGRNSVAHAEQQQQQQQQRGRAGSGGSTQQTAAVAVQQQQQQQQRSAAAAPAAAASAMQHSSAAVTTPPPSAAVAATATASPLRSPLATVAAAAAAASQARTADSQHSADSVLPQPLELPGEEALAVALRRAPMSDPLPRPQHADSSNSSGGARGGRPPASVGRAVGGLMSPGGLSSEDDYAQATEQIWAEAEVSTLTASTMFFV